MPARLAAFVLLVLAAPGCALPPPIPRSLLSGWHAVEAGSIEILGDVPPQELHRLAGELALFDAVFEHLVGWPAQDGDPVSLYLFREPELARRFGLGGALAGWAFATLEGAFATVMTRPNHTETRAILFHEYTHVLLGRNRRGPLPPWYHEGLASYFDTLHARDDAVVVGAAPATSSGWIAAHGPFALDRLFAGSIRELRPREIHEFYATAWALAHYLLSSPEGRRELSRFTRRVARGDPPGEARQAAFGRSIEALEAELSAHVGYLARGVPAETLLDASALAIEPPPAPVARAEEEVAYELGYLALKLGDHAEAGRIERALARSLLGIAVGADDPDARAEAALAETLALDEAADAARSTIRRALLRRPGDLRVRLHAGRVELALADPGEGAAAGPGPAPRAAEAQFRAALGLDPRSASAWFGLGRALRRADRSDEAVVAFESARKFGWSAALDLELGALYLARGRREEALDLLWPIAQDLHGGRQSERAAELIEEAGLRLQAAD